MVDDSSIVVLPLGQPMPEDVQGVSVAEVKYATDGIIMLGMALIERFGPEVAVSALASAYIHMSSQVMPMEDLQDALRQTSEALPGMYSRRAENNRVRLEKLN